MNSPLINITITDKQELDRVIEQYHNGGKALSLLWDYEQILRNAGKHGYEEYLDAVRNIIKENQELYSTQPSPIIDDDALQTVADACLEYFKKMYYSSKEDNDVAESY